MGHRKSKFNPAKGITTAPSVDKVARMLHDGKDVYQVANELGCTPRQVRRAGKHFCERNHVSPLAAFGRVL